MQAYENLLHHFLQISYLSNAAELLCWDQETYMPPKALPFRADQLGYLSGLTHKLLTSPEVDRWLSECENQGFPEDSDEAANVREWRHSYHRAIRLPLELVEEIQKIASLSKEAWSQAREQSDFSIFQPLLQKTIDLQKKAADCWGYEDHPYDALLESYERGASTAHIRTLFAELRSAIMALLPDAIEKFASTPKDILLDHYPAERQQAFNTEVSRAFGLDFEGSRIDTTTHPLCLPLGPCDTRITTRYDLTNPLASLYWILHETGHALYDQGLPKHAFSTPLGEAVSLGIHESQSHFWENHVSRNLSFWKHWHPIAAQYFPKFKSLTPQQLTSAASRVMPSFIRVEADEITYDLHIILRFEIELKLIENTLSVKDIPAYWNENFKQMFSLTVPDDKHGCLQDIHWSTGSFGYFPTYTLGNLNASQIHHTMQTQIPDLQTQWENGDYSQTLNWLRTHIHSHGRRFLPQQLIQNATGTPTQTQAHINYLKQKFS